MSANGFKAVIDIDLLGTFNTCRAAYAFLRKPGASILNISANHATIPIAWQSHVCAAKAGVEMLTQAAGARMGSVGNPRQLHYAGAAPTIPKACAASPPQKKRGEQIERNIPLRRLGTKDELADLALFLSSDAAPYITGAVYVCDGGQSLCRSGLPPAAAGDVDREPGSDSQTTGPFCDFATPRQREVAVLQDAPLDLEGGGHQAVGDRPRAVGDHDHVDALERVQLGVHLLHCARGAILRAALRASGSTQRRARHRKGPPPRTGWAGPPPIRQQASTAGCAISRLSMGAGATYFPLLVLNCSLMRPMMLELPVGVDASPRRRCGRIRPR